MILTFSKTSFVPFSAIVSVDVVDKIVVQVTLTSGVRRIVCKTPEQALSMHEDIGLHMINSLACTLVKEEP